MCLILIREYKITDCQPNTRFINYSIDNFFDEFHSKKAIKKAIKSGALKLNNEVVETGRFVKINDTIQLFDLENKPPKTYNLKFDIVYEDEFFAVINKPAGLTVSGNQYRTVVNALPYNIKISKEIDALKWPKPVHRLDNQTSGLLVIAKTKLAHLNLSKQFENKIIRKKYIAIVIGNFEGSGFIENEIDKKQAKTEYNVLKTVKSLKNEYLTLLELYPHTGRTHQLRIHLSRLGFPILGDKLYGKENLILKHKGLFLSSVELFFKHPISNEDLNIKMKIPQKFISRLNSEERRWGNYNKEI